MRLAATLITIFCNQAAAHHGQDFFVNLDARVPAFGNVTTFASSSYIREAYGGEETTLEPGFLVGTGFGTSLGLTAEWSNSDGSAFGFAGITPIFQWALPISGSPFRIGFSASYHIADSSASVSGSGGGHSHAITLRPSVSPTPSAATTGASNPDAPPPGSGGGHDHGSHDHGAHGHGGIHRHGEDFLSSRLILEWQIEKRTRAVANLIVVSGGRDDTDLGYSIGLRHEITAAWAVGLESIGDLDSGGAHEIVGGLWFAPRHDLNLRLGLGTGIGPGAPELSVRTGLTWRF